MPFWPFRQKRHLPPSSPSPAHDNSIENPGTVANPLIEEAVAALLATQSSNETRRILEDRRDVLLSERAEQLLSDRVKALARNPDAKDLLLDKAKMMLMLVHIARMQGIDVAFKPIDDHLDRSNRALAAFINSRTWEESRRVLEEQHDVLLDEGTLVLLQQAIDSQRAAGNDGGADNLEFHLSLLEQARSQGLAAALGHIDQLHRQRQREREQERVRGLAERLSQDPDGLAAMRVWIAQYQADPARAAAKMPDGFGDFDDARLAEFAQALSQAIVLVDAQHPGMGAEVNPEVQRSLNALFVLESLEPLTRPEQMPQRIALIDDALRQIDPQQDPRTWALLHGERANSWMQSEDSNLEDRVAEAIEDIDAALTIVTPEFDRKFRASLLINRASARGARVHGDRKQQLELALADCEAALAEFSPTHDAESWATALMARANLYQSRIAGDRASNLKQALADATHALTELSEARLPFEYAKASLIRGSIYLNYPTGNVEVDLEHALEDLTNALQLLHPDQSPSEWAHAKVNLSIALAQRITGDRAENVEVALGNINEALGVLTREAAPLAWARALMLRGNIYSERLIGTPNANVRHAIEDFTSALTVLSPDQAPIDWARVLLNRANTYMSNTIRPSAESRLLAHADYTASLRVLSEEHTPQDWASALVGRGIVYGDSSEDEFANHNHLALADFNMVLGAITRTSMPNLWAQALSNRGLVYLQLEDEAQSGNADHALKDFDATLLVYTRASQPVQYMAAQLRRATALESLERWEDAYKALLEAREVHRDMIGTTLTEENRAGLIAEGTRLDMYARSARACLLAVPPNPVDAVCALEEGRTQSLTVALQLDSISAQHLTDVGARNRAASFMEARDSLYAAQRRFRNPLVIDGQDIGPTGLDRPSPNVLALRKALEDYVVARDAIRDHDNPNFLKIESSWNEVARAISSTDEAIVYLASTREDGFALIVCRDAQGKPALHHIKLPLLTTSAILALLMPTVAITEEGVGRKSTLTLPTGGLYRAQTGDVLAAIEQWGETLQEARHSLPSGTGLAEASQTFIESLLPSYNRHDLITKPFRNMTSDERGLVDQGLATALLQHELPRSMRTLGDLGLAEVARWLQAQGVSRVSIVPYGVLALLPLHAARAELNQGTRYLCDIFDINLVPSARLLTEAHRRAGLVDRQSRPLILTVGNPLPLPPVVRSLPFAEAEAQAVARIALNYGYDSGSVTCLTTWSAVKEKVITGLDCAWFTQLSVHGLYDADVPRRSKLILSGDQDQPDEERMITLQECLDGVVHLTGLRLLVLSACDSSIIDIKHAANEMVGLPAGFLQAGAAGVIGSLWAVDDRATYLLMSKFAQLYLDPSGGRSPARALAEAQRWLREEATNRVLAAYDAASVSPSIVRSMRYSLTTAQELTHAQAALATDPDALPYADPIYWAAFSVTGC